MQKQQLPSLVGINTRLLKNLRNKLSFTEFRKEVNCKSESMFFPPLFFFKNKTFSSVFLKQDYEAKEKFGEKEE